MEDIQTGPNGRRLMRRRRMASFSATSSRVDGTPRNTSAEEDEVDQIIDPTEFNNAIRSAPSGPVRRGPSHNDGPVTIVGDEDAGGAPDIDGGATPAQRLLQVNMAGSAAYSKEYRLALLHRLLMRKVPLDQISRMLNISMSTLEKDRVALKGVLRERARELDIDTMIGEQTAFYDEVTGMALQQASTSGTNTAMKMASLRTALAANADKNRFYQVAGVYDVMRFRRSEDGDAISDVQSLMDQTAAMLRELTGGDLGGMTFDPMTLDTSEPESEEL